MRLSPITDKTQLVTKDQLLTWGKVGKVISKSGVLDTVPSHPAIPQAPLAQAKAPFVPWVDVHFPTVDLYTAYISPTAFLGKGEVERERAFRSLLEEGQVSPQVFTRRSDKGGGKLSCHFFSTTTS